MRQKKLIVTAALEAGMGLALIVTPSIVAFLLLGAPLETPAAAIVARVAGAALLALGVACGFASRDTQSRAATGLIAAILLYDVAVAALLVVASFGFGLGGIGLWPGVGLHTAMAIWCLACLRGAKIRQLKKDGD